MTDAQIRTLEIWVLLLLASEGLRYFGGLVVHLFLHATMLPLLY